MWRSLLTFELLVRAEIPNDAADGQHSGGPPSSASIGGAPSTGSGIPNEALAMALAAPGPGKAWPPDFVAAQRRDAAAVVSARAASVNTGERPLAMRSALCRCIWKKYAGCAELMHWCPSDIKIARSSARGNVNAARHQYSIALTSIH